MLEFISDTFSKTRLSKPMDSLITSINIHHKLIICVTLQKLHSLQENIPLIDFVAILNS